MVRHDSQSSNLDVMCALLGLPSNRKGPVPWEEVLDLSVNVRILVKVDDVRLSQVIIFDLVGVQQLNSTLKSCDPGLCEFLLESFEQLKFTFELLNGLLVARVFNGVCWILIGSQLSQPLDLGVKPLFKVVVSSF